MAEKALISVLNDSNAASYHQDVSFNSTIVDYSSNKGNILFKKKKKTTSKLFYIQDQTLNNKQSKIKKVGRFAAIRNWLKQSKWKKKDKITNSNNINKLNNSCCDDCGGGGSNISILSNITNNSSTNNLSQPIQNNCKNYNNSFINKNKYILKQF
jgi:excinuclease UvrABC ATPase subunit